MKIFLFLQKRINLLALIVCAIFSGFWMIILAKKYYGFLDSSWHSAYYAQNLWGILHGDLSPSLLGANFINVHCSFLCFFFAPLYALFPEPILLQYLKIWGFFLGAYVLFLILKKDFNPWVAVGAMMVFTWLPANKEMLEGVFSYEPFAIPLIFLIFKAIQDRKYTLFLTSCFLLTIVKEQMPLLVMAFGVYAFFFVKQDRFKWAVIPFLLGGLIFVIEVFILIPYVRRDLAIEHSYFWLRYAEFGRTPQEILWFLFSHPLVVLQKCFNPENIQWYKNLFGCWGWVALASPQTLLIAAPIFLKNALSIFPLEHKIIAYYGATFMPFIFLATWHTLDHIKNKWRLLLHICFIACMFFILLFSSSFKVYSGFDHDAFIKQRLIGKISSQASVMSSSTTLAPLANRKELYMLRNYFTGNNEVTQTRFEMPSSVEYLLWDRSFKEFSSWTPKGLAASAALNFDGKWDLVESIEDVSLYKRSVPHQESARLVERSLQPFLGMSDTKMFFIGNSLILKEVDFPRIFSKECRIFPVKMYWHCIKNPRADYEVLFRITFNGRTSYFKRRELGSGIYPVNMWANGEYVSEKYFYLLPRLMPGKYSMEIVFYNCSTKIMEQAFRRNFIVE